MEHLICMQTGDLPDQFGWEKACEMIAEAGFEGIDFNLDNSILPSKIQSLQYEGNCIFEKSLDQVEKYWEKAVSAIRKAGLQIRQAHSVYPTAVAGHPEVLEWTSRIHARALEFADGLGCKYVVVHGIPLEADNIHISQQETDEMNMRLYEALLSSLEGRKVICCLENLFIISQGLYRQGACANPEKAVQYIDALNAQAGREAFGLCVDTGHLNLLATDFRSYGPVVGKRVKALHLNDNMGNRDSHRAPFSGSINWTVITDTLRQIGYEGDLSFETFFHTTAAFEYDPELVMPCLRMIAETGKVFRKHLFE